jgi:PAS domain S-box-containing protein
MAPENDVSGGVNLAVLLGDAVDGMFVLDRDYRVVSVYGGCERIIGCSRSDLLGCRCSHRAEALPPSAAEHPWLRLLCPARDLSGGKIGSDSRRNALQHADGSEVWVETTHFPMFDARGEIACILGVVRNITDQVRRERMAGTPAGAAVPEGPVGDASRSDSESALGVRDDSLDGILQDVERREILAALRRARGQRARAARVLGVSRSRLYRRMEALGIDPRVDV